MAIAVFSATHEAHWLIEISILLDLPFDAGLALLFAGLVGPKGDRAAELAEIGRLAAARKERRILDKLALAAKSATGPALALAALFEGVDS